MHSRLGITEPLLFAVVRELRIAALLDDSESITILKTGGMRVAQLDCV